MLMHAAEPTTTTFNDLWAAADESMVRELFTLKNLEEKK